MKFNELEKVWTSNKSPCYLGLTLFPPFLFHCVKLRLLLLSAASTTKKIGLRSDGSRSCAIRNTTTSECVQDESLLSSTPHFQLGKEGCQHSMVKHYQKPKQTIQYQLNLLIAQCTQYHTRLPSTTSQTTNKPSVLPVSPWLSFVIQNVQLTTMYRDRLGIISNLKQ